jgi:hypothetical protein
LGSWGSLLNEIELSFGSQSVKPCLSLQGIKLNPLYEESS